MDALQGKISFYFILVMIAPCMFYAIQFVQFLYSLSIAGYRDIVVEHFSIECHRQLDIKWVITICVFECFMIHLSPEAHRECGTVPRHKYAGLNFSNR